MGIERYTICIAPDSILTLHPGFIEEMRDGYTHPVAAMALPPFHLSGIYGQLLEPIYGGIPVALYPPTALSPDTLPILPSPDNIIAHTRKTKSGMLMCFPTLLATWSKSPDDVTFLKTLSFIVSPLIDR